MKTKKMPLRDGLPVVAVGQTTARKIRERFPVVAASYSSLQEALRGLTPAYYTAGKYGWNADIYLLLTRCHGIIAVATGYRPFGTAIPLDLQDAINSTVFSTVEDLRDAVYRAAFPGKEVGK